MGRDFQAVADNDAAVKLSAVLLIHFDTTDGPIIAARFPEEGNDPSITNAFSRLSGLFVDNEQRRAIQGSEIGYVVEQHSYLAFLHRAVEIPGDHYPRHYFRFTPTFVFAIRPGSSLDSIDRVMHEWVAALESLARDFIMKEQVSGSVFAAITAESAIRQTSSQRLLPHRTSAGWASFASGSEKSTPVPATLPAPNAANPPPAVLQLNSPLDAGTEGNGNVALPVPMIIQVDTPTDSGLISPKGASLAMPTLVLSTAPTLDSGCSNKFDEEDFAVMSALQRQNSLEVTGRGKSITSTADSSDPMLMTGRLVGCSLRDVLRGVFDVLTSGSRHLEFPSGALLSLCVVKPLNAQPPLQSASIVKAAGGGKIKTHRWPFGHPTDDDAVPRRRPASNATLAYESSHTVDMVAYDLLSTIDGETSVRRLARFIGVPVHIAREAVAQLYDLDIIDVAPALGLRSGRASEGVSPPTYDVGSPVLEDGHGAFPAALGGSSTTAPNTTSPSLDAAARTTSAVSPAAGATTATVVPGLRTCVDYYTSMVCDLSGTVYSSFALMIHELRAAVAQMHVSFAIGTRGGQQQQQLRNSSGILRNSSGVLAGGDSFDSDGTLPPARFTGGTSTASHRLSGGGTGTLSSRFDEMLALPIAQSILWDVLPLFDETAGGSPNVVRSIVRLALGDTESPMYDDASSESVDSLAEEADPDSPHTVALVDRLKARALPEALRVFVDHIEAVLLFCGSNGWLVSRFAN